MIVQLMEAICNYSYKYSEVTDSLFTIDNSAYHRIDKIIL